MPTSKEGKGGVLLSSYLLKKIQSINLPTYANRKLLLSSYTINQQERIHLTGRVILEWKLIPATVSTTVFFASKTCVSCYIGPALTFRSWHLVGTQIHAEYINVSYTEYNDFMTHAALSAGWRSLAFLKSSMHSLAFSPNCHLHCVSASYSCPGSFSGYLYSFTGLGWSARHVAWAVLKQWCRQNYPGWTFEGARPPHVVSQRTPPAEEGVFPSTPRQGPK